MIEKVSRIDLIRKAHAVALAEKGDIELAGVLATGKEDVLDEAQHLDALDHVEPMSILTQTKTSLTWRQSAQLPCVQCSPAKN